MLQDKLKFKRLITRYRDFRPRGGTAIGCLVVLGLFGAISLGALWFTPWVFSIPLGASVYFPYEPDGQSRFIQMTGPLSARLGLNAWASESEIPQACFAAVVAAEDTRFRSHRGVDWDSLRSVIEERERQNGGGRIRGASTITQQLVKNLYLSRTRSLLRKSREILGALLLESVASKQTILTWYLNVIELGPRVYGLTQAARFYFKKEPQQLLPHECVSLAVILPSPLKWNASLRSGRYSTFFKRRYGLISARMKILGEVPTSVMREVRRGAPFHYAEPAAEKDPPRLLTEDDSDSYATDKEQAEEADANLGSPQEMPAPPPILESIGQQEPDLTDSPDVPDEQATEEGDEDPQPADGAPEGEGLPELAPLLPQDLPNLPIDSETSPNPQQEQEEDEANADEEDPEQNQSLQ